MSKMRIKCADSEQEDDCDDDLEKSDVKIVVDKNRTYVTIFMNGPVVEDSIETVIETIMMVNSDKLDSMSEYYPVTHINLFICTPGGDFTATCKLIDMFEMSEVPIRTIGWGEVASCGLLMLAAGDERFVAKSAMLMSHPATVTMRLVNHKVSDQGIASLQVSLHELALSMFVRYTGRDSKYVKKHLVKESKDDAWFLSQESIEHGIADHLSPRGWKWLSVKPAISKIESNY